VGSCGRRLVIWSVDTHEEYAASEDCDLDMHAVCFSSGCRVIATLCSAQSVKSGTVIIVWRFDSASRTVEQIAMKAFDATKKPAHMALSGGGDRLFCSVGRQILVLDTSSLDTRATYGSHDEPIKGLICDQVSTSKVISVSYDGTVQLWSDEAPTGAEIAACDSYSCLSNVANQRFAFVANEFDIAVHSFASADFECVSRLNRGHTTRIVALRLNANATRLVSASSSIVNVWDITEPTGRIILELCPKFQLTAVSLSADGRLVVAAHGPELVGWRVVEGGKLFELFRRSGHRSADIHALEHCFPVAVLL
jgi:WD40 repeat protein